MVLRVGSGYFRMPFGLLETEGVIYVDSPEIYTRERLVNDRYNQDYWLREQLKRLDSATNLVTGWYSEQLQTGFTAPGVGRSNTDKAGGAAHGEQEDGAGTRPVPPGVAEEVLSFGQEFRVRAAILDTIRQLVLENMLDDRHDLTGNSVFGLKFDTTVIPGDNTHKRAFIRVSLTTDSLQPDPIRAGIAGSNDGGALPKHVSLYHNSRLADIRSNRNNALNRYYSLYEDWLQDMQFRLND